MTWSLLAGTICLMRSTRRSGAGHCQWVLADGCLDFNQWSIIPHLLQGTEPNKAAHALAPIDTQPVSWGEATEALLFYPILSYRWTRETFRPLATWMPSCNPFWGPKSTVKQITSELIHALIWFRKGSHQPLQCGLGAIKWLGPSPVQGRGHRPWAAGGTWSHFSYICSSTSTSNDFSETSNSKSRLISNVFISLFLSWVFPWSNWSLQGRCLHPKTCCSKYPQHQMLLRKHTGECVGQGNPYFPSLSHSTPQEACPPLCSFQLQRPRPHVGLSTGKKLHDLHVLN